MSHFLPWRKKDQILCMGTRQEDEQSGIMDSANARYGNNIIVKHINLPCFQRLLDCHPNDVEHLVWQREGGGKVQKGIPTFSPNISKIQFFHVKCQDNKEVDNLTNISAKLRQGEMVINNSRPIIKWKKKFINLNVSP